MVQSVLVTETVVTAVLAASVGGCGAEEEPSFLFEVRLNQVPAEVMDVEVDDPESTIHREGSAYRIARIYPSYSVARSSEPIRLSVSWADSTSTATHTKPGACALQCVYPWCPTPEQTVFEALELGTPYEYAPFEAECVVCGGGGHEATFCR
jgi:hypothetical protein